MNTPFDFRAELYQRVTVSRLHAAGFTPVARGAERSDLHPADLALVGKVTEFQCLRSGDRLNCRTGVTWQMYDVETRRLLYKTITRAVLYEVERTQIDNIGRRLIQAAVDSLAARGGFKRRMAREEETSSFKPAAFQRCLATKLMLPRQAEAATQAAVIIQHRYGIGSGFFLNREGLVLTAAHVVRYPDLSVTLRDGRTFPAGVVRINTKADVALLRIDGNDVPRCNELATSPPLLGADTYVIGSPAGTRQAFSLSRGIISGVRLFDGLGVLQTDASVSPGNSGGPLLDSQGRVLGIVSRKLVHEAVEGISYAVSIDAALSALGLHSGAQSDPELSQELLPVLEDPYEWEADDALPGLLTPLDSHATSSTTNATSAPEPPLVPHSPSHPQPTYVSVLRWGGMAVAIAGMTLVTKSMIDNDPKTTTRDEFASLQMLNGVGWGVAGLGMGAFATSFLLQPETSSPQVSTRAPGHSAGVRFVLQGRY